MQHQFEFTLEKKKIMQSSTLVVKGENSIDTAMAKTVGIPVAIVSRLILNGKIPVKGIHVPVYQSIYEPVLKELKEMGIGFIEKQTEFV